MKKKIVLNLVSVLLAAASWQASGADIFVECESFKELGGWVVDAYSMRNIGSAYIMAHGYGRPVISLRMGKTAFAAPFPRRRKIRWGQRQAPPAGGNRSPRRAALPPPARRRGRRGRARRFPAMEGRAYSYRCQRSTGRVAV